MHVLGISCFFHDAAAALLKDGVLVAAAEEERFTRKKHDFEFPIHAIEHVLAAGGIAAGALDYVAFFEKPFVKFERILMTSLQMFPRATRVFREAMITWLLDKLWVSALITERLGVPRDRILFSEHHLSHAASSFFCSPFDEAAVLTVDGVGEWATATMGRARGTGITLAREIRFPHSIGLLYSTFTAFLGFEVNEGEYKVMGLAPYGVPRYVDDVRKLVRMAPDGSFRLDMDYFTFHHSTRLPYGRKFLALFGEPRAPEGAVTPHYADVAASIQAVTEELVLNMARAVQRETGLTRLCLAGGVALNSVANWKILRQTGFEELYVQPAAGDSGGAVGAALYAYHSLLGHPRRFVMEHAFWGAGYGEAAIGGFLDGENIPYERLPEPALLDRVVELLAAGQVVGWFQGRFEWGPRALGHRSILADPRRAEMKDVVNTKIKFREPYRPFAPSVLAERVPDFFDAPGVERQYPARFMLLVTDVRPDKRAVIPAVTHVDGTGRLQSVVREGNTRYYDLIARFGQATGVPVVLNTSFNVRGEPIVNTPGEAYRTFAQTGLDALVLGDHLVRKAH
ncbi:MAG: carbamoyltransferase [Candidatus Rokubacteria bacterium]|nr:carbamoyltransferase [Candidatus Rokubacteria bacterium]